MPLVPPDPRLSGRWTRTLLETADGRADVTTWVTWLQGERWYVDLRLPAAGLPPADCLRDLSYDDLLALTVVEGFAGELVADGPWACWRRSVDLQPAQGLDEGRLDPVDADRVVETGRDGSYREHWTAAPAAPVAGLLLADPGSAALAVLVRVGDDVAWARGHATALPAGRRLADLVAAAPDLTAAQDLLDAEVSLVRGGVVAHSSLPWRVGGRFVVDVDGGRVRTHDVAADGGPLVRTWSVLSSDGDPTTLQG